MEDIKFKIEKMIGDLSEEKTGWTIEFNHVSWNDREAKYDIRNWSAEGKPGKGIALTDSELKKLRDLISTIDL